MQVGSRHGKGFLDLSHCQNPSQHLLHVLLADGLGGVPDGAVGSHHRLRRQVEGVVPSLHTLGTEQHHSR